jgi:hypothetical protein
MAGSSPPSPESVLRVIRDGLSIPDFSGPPNIH